MSDDAQKDAGGEPLSEEPPPDRRAPPDGPLGDKTPEPPLAAMGIVAGTVVGALIGLILGHLPIGAGIGCAAGLIIGAAAQALRARR